jgi:uracil-DNA glycosylase family 4
MATAPLPEPPQPGRDCPLCPRLVATREALRLSHPDWHNAPVPPFGPITAPILIVGLAPGREGANRTGRPFTGDWAGDLLFATLLKLGLAEGVYDERPDDGLTLTRVRISNSVRCLPPGNKPTPAEIATCRPFLVAELPRLPRLRVLVALGRIAHESALRALDLKPGPYPFAHGARHALPVTGPAGRPLVLYDSYHCSRYNTNTGRLTPAMFEAVFRAARDAVQE